MGSVMLNGVKHLGFQELMFLLPRYPLRSE